MDITDGTLVLAGPGVVAAGAVDGLRRFAAAANVGVANTWGAKGVFGWSSPHHLGTAGLQADDFVLLGFGEADRIVATGIDELESPRTRFALAPVVDVAPDRLAALAAEVRPRPSPIAPTRLYERLAAVVQPGYADESVPLHPARLVAEVKAAAAGGGALVCGAPDLAGFWVARAFPTDTLGSVLVPATTDPSRALAAARAACSAGRPAVLVTTEAIADAPHEGAPLVVVRAGADGAHLTPARVRAAIEAGLARSGATLVHVAVELARTRELVAVAGPVVAFGGLAVPV